MRIVRYLGHRAPVGASVRDIARGCELATGTTHRLLQCLMAEDMVLRERATSRLYRLGPMALGLGAEGRRHHFDWMRPIVRPHLEALAADLRCAAQHVVRVGRYGICVDRVDGVALGAPEVIHVGESALLGYGAASLALLSAMPPFAADELLWENRWTTTRAGIATETLSAMLEKARSAGYAYSDGMFLPNITCVSMCIPAQNDVDTSAVSLYFGVPLLDEERLRSVVDRLSACTMQLSAPIHAAAGRGARRSEVEEAASLAS